MKLARSENAKKGIMLGSLDHIYRSVVPFIIRTIMMYVLGMEYLGLNSLFNSILQVLNLAELGVCGAMVYSMYKPIAEDDEDTICALLRLYRTYYRIIGTVILGVGLALIPFLPSLIKDEIPKDLNLFVLYLLNLAASVLSYWLFAYKASILQAFGRKDVESLIAIFLNTIKYVSQIIALWVFKNYYAFFVIQFVMQIVSNIYTAVWVDRLYPNYKPKGTPDASLKAAVNAKIKDLFTVKIGDVVNKYADNLVISGRLGIVILGAYQNYAYILTLPLNLIYNFFDSVRSGIGNSLELEVLDKNRKDMFKISFLFLWAITVCMAGLVAVYRHFMYLWVGNSPERTFSDITVLLLLVNFYVNSVKSLLDLFKDAAGIWHEDRFRPLVVAIVNLVGNIILISFVGINGILVSTIVTVSIINFPWEIRKLFGSVYGGNAKEYVLFIVEMTVKALLCCVAVYFATFRLPMSGVLWFIIKGVLSVIVSNACFILLNLRGGRIEYMRELIKRFIHKS